MPFSKTNGLSHDSLRCMHIVALSWLSLSHLASILWWCQYREMHEWSSLCPHAGVKWKPGKEGGGVVSLVWSILHVGGAHSTMCGRWCVLHVVTALSLPPQDAEIQEEIKRVCE